VYRPADGGDGRDATDPGAGGEQRPHSLGYPGDVPGDRLDGDDADGHRDDQQQEHAATDLEDRFDRHRGPEEDDPGSEPEAVRLRAGAERVGDADRVHKEKPEADRQQQFVDPGQRGQETGRERSDTENGDPGQRPDCVPGPRVEPVGVHYPL